MTEDVQTQVSPPPRVVRSYIQWGEKDIDLLLKELEKPGAYKQWKENKTGYSKKVAEQVFHNSMGQDAIKFKIRWLEKGYENWHSQFLDLPNQPGLLAIRREKMLKEFPYYDRFKAIYDNDSSTSMLPATSTTTTTAPVSNNVLDHAGPSTIRTIPAVIPADPTSPTSNTVTAALSSPSSSTSSNAHQVPFNTQTIPFKRIASNAELPGTDGKRPRVEAQTENDASNSMESLEGNASEQFSIKKMEYDLAIRKMDHEEKMQQMKLEQLKLEIELQKLKNHTSNRLSPNFA